ncbi:MAG: EamA family transporter [Paracoccus sp. (in: a-proteobacteria)]|uniref:EamA family transporter n=1 Tax=Paracoccus sp. TaxID=267 RepID=UPI00391DAAC2
MSRQTDILLAACAPAIWGSTYIVTSQMLPAGYPLTDAALRALPAGLVLMMVTRHLPPAAWLGRLAVLGGLNFAVFWAALFVAAYRLPGGVAATLGAVQPMIVLLLARLALDAPLTRLRLAVALAGIAGVALLVLGPRMQLDPVGIVAALTGAVSMACGVVLTRKWRPDVPTLTLTAWQLTAGGLLLAPAALWFEPHLPVLSGVNILGFLWLGSFGAAISYFFWFRGIERLGPSAITSLGFLSPLTAVVLGWAILGETLSPVQLTGAVIVLICAWLGTRPAPASSGG